jgi:hypothetical protein
VFRLHHLSGAKAERANPGVDLDPEQQPVRQECREKARRRLSELRRGHLNMASRKASSARPQNLGSLVAPQTPHSKGAVKLSELSVAGHRRHRVVRVLVSVAAEQSEDNHPATANLARHLVVQVLARREAAKSVGNLAPINLQPRRLPVQVRAKRKADDRQGKGPMINVPASQKAERQLRLSKGRGNRSAERKRARGLHRRGHNYLVNFRGAPEQSSGPYKFTAILRSAPRLVPRL